MRIEWTQLALEHRLQIVQYLTERSPNAVRLFEARVDETTRLLEHQPFVGRVGRLPDTREVFPLPTYRLVYRVAEETVRILMLVHTSRRWPLMERD